MEPRAFHAWLLTCCWPPGFAAFDEIRYRPGARQPGSTTRYGDWLYLHEWAC